MASHVQARRTRHTRTSFNGRVHALTLGARTHNCKFPFANLSPRRGRTQPELRRRIHRSMNFLFIQDSEFRSWFVAGD